GALINTSVDNTVNGARLANECKKAMEDIKMATVEQKDKMDQINQASKEMDTVTQQNAATAEETASASEELSAQAQTMRDQVRDLSMQIGIKAGEGSYNREKPVNCIPENSRKRNEAISWNKGNGGSSKAESLIPLDADSGSGSSERFEGF
ncbi:MAG: hypothetical protein GY931_08575, partial [Maribacter sp.]|nr:hypothetical protein [Maribacter sp.]